MKSRRRRAAAVVIAAGLAVPVGSVVIAEEDASATAAVSFAVADDGRVRIEVPSAADLYHVLYYQPDPDDATVEYAVQIRMGASGSVVLDEPLQVGPGVGAYRVAAFRRDAPGDVDGDGTDDLAETSSRTSRRAAL